MKLIFWIRKLPSQIQIIRERLWKNDILDRQVEKNPCSSLILVLLRELCEGRLCPCCYYITTPPGSCILLECPFRISGIYTVIYKKITFMKHLYHTRTALHTWICFSLSVGQIFIGHSLMQSPVIGTKTDRSYPQWVHCQGKEMKTKMLETTVKHVWTT